MAVAADADDSVEDRVVVEAASVVVAVVSVAEATLVVSSVVVALFVS